MDFDSDVLIAGAGPAGMAAALALTASGHSVHIVDKHEHGLGFSRAILVNGSTMSLLEPFGVAGRIAARGRPVQSLAVRGPSGVVLAGHVADPAPGVSRPIGLPQLETEACLREALAERGVVAERPCALVSFTQDSERVSATLESLGAPRPFRCRYLIGADGFHSRVREVLGIGYKILAPDALMYSSDAVMTPPFPEDVNVWLLDEGAAMAFRIGERLIRFAATSRAAFDALGLEPLIEAKTWETDFEAHFAQASAYGAGRVWLAGDAAHVHSPVGGRGMNMGIADGVRLAHAIGDGDFAAYQRERAGVAEPWVRTNVRLTSFAGLPGPLGELARKAVRGALHAAYWVKGESLAQTMFQQMTMG